MLSSSTASAPARAASATWSRVSHSTSTIRPGHSARARRTASAMLEPARWLSFTRTASDRPARWLVPPPARTAAFSRTRSPGVVLRVSRTCDRRVALVRRRHVLRGQRGDARQVAEEVERGALGGEDRAQRARHLHDRVAGRHLGAVGHVPDELERGVDLPEGLDGAGPPGQHAVCRARNAKWAVTSAGHQRRRQVAVGPRSSASARATASRPPGRRPRRLLVGHPLASRTAPGRHVSVDEPAAPRRVGVGVLAPGMGAPALGARRARRRAARRPAATRFASSPAPTDAARLAEHRRRLVDDGAGGAQRLGAAHDAGAPRSWPAAACRAAW